MLGLVKGILADGIVSAEEAELLSSWMARHSEAIGSWPGNILSRRLTRIFADGVASEEERDDLAGLLKDLVGGKAGIIAEDTASTALPFR